MTKVVVDMSMSLDGFITEPSESVENPLGDEPGGLHDWTFGAKSDDDAKTDLERGDADVRMSSKCRSSKTSRRTIRRISAFEQPSRHGFEHPWQQWRVGPVGIATGPPNGPSFRELRR